MKPSSGCAAAHWGRTAFLVAVLVLDSPGAQKPRAKQESPGNGAAIAAGKSADVHQLDSKLAAEKFESWLERQVGDTPIAWESNHCGEALSSGADRDRDPPTCAQAAVTFADGATATVAIGVGSEKTGIHPPYQVWMIEVAEGRPGRTLELHDLVDILAAHRRLTTTREPAPGPAPKTTTCGPLLPGAEDLIRQPAFILIGEVRGTQEAPSFVRQLACYLAKNSEVLLALDIPASEQESINKFLSSSGSKDDVQSLLTGDFWGRGLQDGRASRAVLALLNQARILRQAGRAISIACIDAPEARAQDKNRIWAANILRAKLAHPNAAVVALLSRTSARTQIGLPGNPDYVPAGRYLKEKVPHLVSLSMSFAHGSAWGCQQDGCAIHQLEGDEQGDRAYVHLGAPLAQQESANGTLFFPTIAASEPAKTLLRAKTGRPAAH